MAIENAGYAARQNQRDREYKIRYEIWLKSLSKVDRKRVGQLGLVKADIDRVAKKANHSVDIGDMNLAEQLPKMDFSVTSEGMDFMPEFFSIVFDSGSVRLSIESIILAVGAGKIFNINEVNVARRHDITSAALARRVRKIQLKLGLPSQENFRKEAAICELVGLILSSKNTLLSAQCLALAVGFDKFLKNDANPVTEASIAREHRVTRAAVSKRVKSLTKLLGLKPGGVMRGQKNRQNCQSSRFKVLAKSKLSDENTLRWKSEEKARLAKDKIFRKKIRSLGEKLADLQKIHGPVNTWKHAELEILRLSFSKMVNFIEELKKRVSDLS